MNDIDVVVLSLPGLIFNKFSRIRTIIWFSAVWIDWSNFTPHLNLTTFGKMMIEFCLGFWLQIANCQVWERLRDCSQSLSKWLKEENHNPPVNIEIRHLGKRRDVYKC